MLKYLKYHEMIMEGFTYDLNMIFEFHGYNNFEL